MAHTTDVGRPDWEKIVAAVCSMDAMRFARVEMMLRAGQVPNMDDIRGKEVFLYLTRAALEEALWRKATKHADELATRCENRRIADLRELVAHCCVHAGDANCGREKMRLDMGQLYDEIVGAAAAGS